MEPTIERVNVWAASVRDEIGGLGQLLAGLQDAGADLDFILARRCPDRPGEGVVFVTPLRGDAEMAAAAELGFNVASTVHSVRVEGDNRAGLAARLTTKLGAAGITLRGLSAGVIGPHFVLYIGLDTVEDADRAVEVLQRAMAATVVPQ